MPATIYTAHEMHTVSQHGPESALYRATSGACWVNLVTKDHTETLVAEVHDDETDIYLVVEGEAVLWLDGTLVAATTVAPGQHRGANLTGAVAHLLQPGDLIIIPAGTPHMIDARQTRLVYAVIKQRTA